MSRPVIKAVRYAYLGRENVVRGRFAQTLVALVNAGTRGITALEMNSWAFRLGHYVWRLRHRDGLPITTTDEPHEGGSHGRYSMVADVQIIAVEYAERSEERAAA